MGSEGTPLGPSSFSEPFLLTPPLPPRLPPQEERPWLLQRRQRREIPSPLPARAAGADRGEGVAPTAGGRSRSCRRCRSRGRSSPRAGGVGGVVAGAPRWGRGGRGWAPEKDEGRGSRERAGAGEGGRRAGVQRRLLPRRSSRGRGARGEKGQLESWGRGALPTPPRFRSFVRLPVLSWLFQSGSQSSVGLCIPPSAFGREFQSHVRSSGSLPVFIVSAFQSHFQSSGSL